MNVDERIKVRNTDTGAVGFVARRIFDNSKFNPDGLLVEVDEDAKPYVSELYTSKFPTPADIAPKPEDGETTEKDAD